MVKLLSLVRREVTFRPKETIQIPYEYNYDIMKSIYYYIAVADEQMEKFLHNKGYRVEEGHRYKLFNFTLLFKGAKFNKDHIEVDNKSEVILILSGKKEILSLILKGLIHIKQIRIDNNDIPLEDITNVKNILFKNIMLYKALSPIITTTKSDEGKTYSLKPYVDKYYINLAENLKKKYRLIYKEDFSGPLFFDIDDVLVMKTKSHVINEIYKKGYVYDIWVETTPKMQRIIYYLGLGENNSTGAGCLSLLRMGE